MNLYDALRGVARGQAIRRPSWGGNIVVEMTEQDGEGRVMIRQADGGHPWTISASDLEADDWTVLTKLAAEPRRSPLKPKMVRDLPPPPPDDAPLAPTPTATAGPDGDGV